MRPNYCNVVNSTTSATLFRLALRSVAALLCLTVSGVSQALDVDREPLTLKTEASAVSPVMSSLLWLRDVTAGAWAVTEKTISVVEPYPANSPQKVFTIDRALFRPLNHQPQHDVIKRLLKRQVRFETVNGVQIQCEVKRYRTLEEGKEMGVKLGMQYKFR